MPTTHWGFCTGEDKHEVSQPYGRKLITSCPLTKCGAPIEWRDKAAKKIMEEGYRPSEEELYEQDV